jgi:PAS domain S-box-containing protein
MSLKYIFFAIATFSVAAVFFAYQQSERSTFEAIERTNRDKAAIYTKSVAVAIDTVAEQQKFFARDYSHWDGMADAVQKKNISWIESEFYGPLEIYKSEAVWVLLPDGSPLYSQQATMSGELKKLALPAFDWSSINSSDYNQETEIFFSFDQENSLIAYHITPIFYHSRASEPQQAYGYVVIADVWNDEVLAKLAATLQAEVTLVPHREEVARGVQTSQKLVATLTGVDNEPVADLIFEFRDHSVALLSDHFNAVSRASTAFGLVGIVVCLLIFHFGVSYPIQKMIHKLRIANNNSNPDGTGGSELKILAREIDKSLLQASKIEHKNQELEEAEKKLELAFTDLKKAEIVTKKQLQTSVKLSKAVDSASEAVVITDTEGMIEYVNPAWQKLNGYTQEEVMGKKTSVVRSGRTNSLVYQRMWASIKSGEPFSSDEVINRRKDGSLYAAHVSIFPVDDGKSPVNFVGMARDISAQKEQDHLRSEFISLASHQLRTPLTSLRWLSELLYKQVKTVLPKDQLQTIRDIQTNSIRMIALVNRLLNLSRIETGRLSIAPHAVAIRSFINSIKKEAAPVAKRRRVKLVFKLAKNLESVRVDGDLLFEIIINLVGNAIKYTKQGGKVSVEVRESKTQAFFTVTDTGIGIPEADQQHVFDRFFRAPNALAHDENGTGLGLYLVKLLASCLGGAVILQSKENSGTTIEFSVPKKSAQKLGEVKILKSTFNFQVRK